MTNRLAPRVEGRKIEEVSVIRQNGRYLPGKEAQRLEGHQILNLYNLGKYMVFDLEGSHKKMVAHNAMSGYWDLADDP